MTVATLDRLETSAARAALARCCGASRWIGAMMAARPFEDRAGLEAAAERAFETLGEADWHEAFEHHPRLGDLEALERRYAPTAAWAGAEQRGALGADAGVLARLADGNARYEARFGHRFIVCATGLTAEQMLERLEQRLANDPARELEVAAEEVRRITRLRLAKLVEGAS